MMKSTRSRTARRASRSVLLVIDGYLAIDDERRGRQLHDHGDDLGKARGVVDAVAADQPDGASGLVGHHPPAIHLFFVDPAGPMERLGERRRHGRQSGQVAEHWPSLYHRAEMLYPNGN